MLSTVLRFFDDTNVSSYFVYAAVAMYLAYIYTLFTVFTINR